MKANFFCLGVGEMLLEEFRDRVKSLRELIAARSASALLLSKCCNFSGSLSEPGVTLP